MSQALEDKITQIQEKLQRLIKQHTALSKENQSLRLALAEAKEQSAQAQQTAEALRHQLDARKYSQALMDPEERKNFEKKLNGYIKEIDKCIALLSV